MNSRVRLLRKSLNMSQEDFGTRLGVTGAGISKIESGKRNLTAQMVILICNEFNVNEEWLRQGEGEIFRQKFSAGMEQLAQNYQLDELDKRIIHEYITLSPKHRKIIKEFIMKIAYGLNSDIMSDGDSIREVYRCAEGSDIDFI